MEIIVHIIKDLESVSQLRNLFIGRRRQNYAVIPATNSVLREYPVSVPWTCTTI